MSYPEEPVLKVGLQDKVKGARKDLFSLEEQTREPNSIELLSDVKRDTPEVLSLLEGRGNGIGDAEALLDNRVKGSESEMVGGDELIRFRIRRRRLSRSLSNIFEKRGKRLIGL